MQKHAVVCSLLGSLLCQVAALAVAPSAESPVQDGCGTSPRPMRIVARHIDGKGIGYHTGYTTWEGFFAPPEPWQCRWWQGSWVPFVDLRGHIFNDGKPALNTGVGTRYIGSRVWGLNLYYDYRKTEHQSYNQIGVGLESLGDMYDLRLNGYVPVGQKSSSLYHIRPGGFKGHYMWISSQREFDMGGVNGEVGARIQTICGCPLYVALGPYYLHGRQESAWGGQARASIDVLNYVRLEGNSSYDHLFKWVGQGQVSLILPFGGRKKVRQPTEGSGCSQVMNLRKRAYQRVDRNEIIPVDKHRRRSVAINPATGAPYFFLFVDNTSHSNGTIESPYPTLLAAQNHSSPGDIIYVFPGDGTSQGMNGIALQDFQKLWGAGIPHPLMTQLGSIIVPSLGVGLPLLTGVDGVTGAGVKCANSNEIAGLHILGGVNMDTTTSPAILVQDVSNVDIRSNLIGSANTSGVLFSNVAGMANVVGNTFNAFPDTTHGFGVAFGSTPGNAAFVIALNQFVGSNEFLFTGVEFSSFSVGMADFTTITLAHNLFSKCGNGTFASGKPIGGAGFSGKGRLMIDSNTFDQSGSGTSGYVKLTAKSTADVILKITNNIWTHSTQSGKPAVSINTDTNTSRVCVTLQNNRTDTFYSYDNSAGGVFTANPASDSGSHNVGHIDVIGVVTPGVCP